MSDDAWYGADPLEPVPADPYAPGRRAAQGRPPGQYPQQPQGQYPPNQYPQGYPAQSQQPYHAGPEPSPQDWNSPPIDYSNPQAYQYGAPPPPPGPAPAGRRRQAPPPADPYSSAAQEYPARGAGPAGYAAPARDHGDGYPSGASTGGYTTGGYATGSYATGNYPVGGVPGRAPEDYQDPYARPDAGHYEPGDTGGHRRPAPGAGGTRRRPAAEEPAAEPDYPARSRRGAAYAGSEGPPVRSRRRETAPPDDEQDERFDLMGQDEEETGRRGRKPKQKKGRNCLAVFIAFAVLAGGLGYGAFSAYSWYQGKYGPPPDFASSTGIAETVDVTIPAGSGGRTIGDLLFKADVVKSQRAFTEACSANAQCANIQANTYLLHKEMSAAAAVTALLSLNNVDDKSLLIARPGERAATVFAGLEKKKGWADADIQAAIAGGQIDLPSWDSAKPGAKFPYAHIEGFIASETYTLSAYSTPTALLKKMVDDQLAVFAEEGMADKAKSLGLTEYQLLTVASMARAEAGSNPADLNKITGVIYNRLKSVSFQHLGFDTVTLYGMGNSTTTPDNLDKTNPYNTSVHGIVGLPPGPIDNPDQKAVDAALNPNDKTDLYFCAYDDAGDTAYAVTPTQWHELGLKYPGKCG